MMNLLKNEDWHPILGDLPPILAPLGLSDPPLPSSILLVTSSRILIQQLKYLNPAKWSKLCGYAGIQDTMLGPIVHEENAITSLPHPYYATMAESASNLTLPSWLPHTQEPPTLTNSHSPHMYLNSLLTS